MCFWSVIASPKGVVPINRDFVVPHICCAGLLAKTLRGLFQRPHYNSCQDFTIVACGAPVMGTSNPNSPHCMVTFASTLIDPPDSMTPFISTFELASICVVPEIRPLILTLEFIMISASLQVPPETMRFASA